MNITTKAQYNKAIAKLEEAAHAYYESSDLVIDDATYDELISEVAKAQAANPSWGKASILEKVAGGVSDGGDVTHKRAMLSLDNAFSDEELKEWHDRMLRVVSETEVALCVEPKLDGLALSAWYEGGKLVRVVTRGDGQSGEDVTRRAGQISGLPASIDSKATCEVRGECVMTLSQFEDANKARTGNGDAAFANPRNAVAGAIRRKSDDVLYQMTFAAYSVYDLPEVSSLSHSALMARLADMGFTTAIGLGAAFGAGRVANIEDAVAACNNIAANRVSIDCGIDGAVVKADEPAVRDQAGETGRAPRWATARKFPPDTRTTTLLDIECSIGRTGALTVRAKLAPVAVGGVTIEYCTLSNPSEIKRKDLRIGDTVWVRRAGEVIPEITSVLLSERAKGLKPWTPPTLCPRCQGGLDKSQRVWRCDNGRSCGLAESLIYAASRDALDIEGLGKVLIEKLIKEELLSDVADIFELKASDISGLENMGDLSAKKVIDQIDLAKSAPLSRLLCSLGIRGTGRRMCRRIAEKYVTMDNFLEAGLDSLSEVEGVGSVRAELILTEVAELQEVIERLIALGVGVAEPVTDSPAEGPFTGKRVCVTGSIANMNREEAQARVESLGGVFVSGVTSKTDILVCGDGGGGKRTKAESLGVAVMEASAFLAL